MSTRVTVSLATLLALGACGGSDPEPEVVVTDAAGGAGTPSLLGATAGEVYWAVAAGTGPRRVLGASLATLPAAGAELAAASGPAVQVGDHVLLATDATIVRVSVATPAAKVAMVTPDALGESLDADPLVVWTEGPVVTWGVGDAMQTATLTKITRCDHVRVSATTIYVAADGTTGRRLLGIDRASGTVSALAASTTFADQFPGGAVDGATYRGRLVGADATGAQWLVEELAAGTTTPARAILVDVPAQGTSSVRLAHVGAVTGFFVTDDAFYWQEADAILTAPRSGGAASITGHLPGTAGAFADGYIYATDGGAIQRLAVE